MPELGLGLGPTELGPRGFRKAQRLGRVCWLTQGRRERGTVCPGLSCWSIEGPLCTKLWAHAPGSSAGVAGWGPAQLELSWRSPGRLISSVSGQGRVWMDDHSLGSITEAPGEVDEEEESKPQGKGGTKLWGGGWPCLLKHRVGFSLHNTTPAEILQPAAQGKPHIIPTSLFYFIFIVFKRLMDNSISEFAPPDVHSNWDWTRPRTSFWSLKWVPGTQVLGP